MHSPVFGASSKHKKTKSCQLADGIGVRGGGGGGGGEGGEGGGGGNGGGGNGGGGNGGGGNGGGDGGGDGGGGGGGEGGEGGGEGGNGGGEGHESGFLAEVFTQSFTMFTPDEGPGNLFVPPHALYAPIEKNQLPWSTVPSIKFEPPLLYSKPLKL